MKKIINYKDYVVIDRNNLIKGVTYMEHLGLDHKINDKTVNQYLNKYGSFEHYVFINESLAVLLESPIESGNVKTYSVENGKAIEVGKVHVHL